MGISLTSTDELNKETKEALLWPKGSDKSKITPLEAVFHKCEETGEIIIAVDDPEELDNLALDIQLNDGQDSKYSGTFDKDGVLKS